MSFMLLGILNAQASGGGVFPYSLRTLGGSSTDEGRGVAFDSQSNFYVVGRNYDGSNEFLVVKYSSSGAIDWQKKLSGGSEYAYSVAVDSSDNIIVSGFTDSATTGQEDALLVKLNSSGTVIWQRITGKNTGDISWGVALDSSNNSYSVIQGYYGGVDVGLGLVKHNSSGVLQWQKSLYDSSGNNKPYGIDIDSSDNVYVVGASNAGFQKITLFKYNTSGTLQWQKGLSLGSGGHEGYAITTDSSGNIYVTGVAPNGSFSDSMPTAKISATGTLLWARLLEPGLTQGQGITVDGDGNVYTWGSTTVEGEGSSDFVLVKYNASGVIQFQRTLGSTALERPEFGGIVITADNKLAAVGKTSSSGVGNHDLFLAVLPSDGSLTGTYSLDGANWVYVASTLTDSAFPGTIASTTLTAGTPTMVDQSSSLTLSATSLVEYSVDL